MLKILPLFILVIPGLIAAVLFPEIVGDEAYPALLSSNILPVGIKGLVVAGLLSAIMSSLSGVFNTIATLYVNDFYALKHPEANERKLVLVGRLVSTIVVVAAILCVPLVKAINSQMYLFLQSTQAFISPPIAAIFLFGLLFKQISSKAALVTLIGGEIIGFSRFISDLMVNLGYTSSPFLAAYSSINFLHFAIFLFLTCTTFLFLINFISYKNYNITTAKLNYSFRESILELPSFLKIRKSKGSFIMSGFILLMIIGVWTLWS
jgi:SSS family solute:Na+ symporter